MGVDHIDLEGLAFCCPPFPLALTLFHSSLAHISLSPEWENLMETSHLRLRVPRSLTLCLWVPSASGENFSDNG